MIADNPRAAGKNRRPDAPQIAAAIRLTADWADGVGASIAYVFQEPTLMPWATLIDHARLPLRIVGVSGDAARARIEPVFASLAHSGLEDAYPAELSGGMRMRASIARALVIRPRVLLMDEPFAALDGITRARLNDDLIALWQAQGFTVLFVTHSVFEAVYLSQRVLVMSARPGRLIADLAIDLPYPPRAEQRQSAAYAEGRGAAVRERACRDEKLRSARRTLSAQVSDPDVEVMPTPQSPGGTRM